MDASTLLYVALATIAGVAIGLLLGLWRTLLLTRKLAATEAALASRAEADLERERLLTTTAERLGSATAQQAALVVLRRSARPGRCT